MDQLHIESEDVAHVVEMLEKIRSELDSGRSINPYDLSEYIRGLIIFIGDTWA